MLLLGLVAAACANKFIKHGGESFGYQPYGNSYGGYYPNYQSYGGYGGYDNYGYGNQYGGY